jgi:NADPH:quinone reductase-like Zn-dependent oxidoreductase
MKIKRVLKWGFLTIVIVLVIWFQIAYWTSSNDCERLTAGQGDRMKAAVYCDYGLANVKYTDVKKPVPTDDQMLVKVRAVSVNPYDWHFIEGTPYIMRGLGVGLRKPKDVRLGVDYAGTVEAVGKNVTKFKPGDDVFGGRTGAFAEYICVRPDRGIALKPANISPEQAASVNIAAITALQGLRDKGKVQPGQKVLINGASGGVGTFAVQIAKSMGAEVTGVCSGRNIELVKSLGADYVIDYTKEDFAKSGKQFDVLLDNVPNHSLSDCRSVLTPQGKYVMIGGGGPNDNPWVGPFGRVIQMVLLKPFVKQPMTMMMADSNATDLTLLAGLMETGKVKPIIDRTYKISDLPAAIRYLEEGHARGKVVLTVD